MPLKQKVIVHADNDFLIEEEQKKLEQKIRDFGAIPFVTEGSDIESYFVTPEHISSILGEDVEPIKKWLDEIASAHHNKLIHKFSRKRDEAKRKYHKNADSAPETVKLLGDDVPLPEEKRLGKFMLSKVRSGMQEKFGKTVGLIQKSESLTSNILECINTAMF